MDFATGFATGLAFGKKKFGGGGEESGKIEHDPDYQEWLDLPEPDETQAVFLIKTGENKLNSIFEFYVSSEAGYSTEEGYYINWGDGSDTQLYAKSVSVASHTYTEAGEYIVTFSSVCEEFCRGIGAIKIGSAYAMLIMVKYGSKLFLCNGANGVSGHKYLRYVRIPPINNPSLIAGCFSNCYALAEVEWKGAITALTKSMFNFCHNLKFESLKFNLESFDIPEKCFVSCNGLTSENFPFNKITSIGESAFSGCNFTNINLPNCISIGKYGFNNCLFLKNVIAQNCTSVGYSGFGNCYSLLQVTFSEECTFDELGSFSNCYSLNPKPDGTL